MLNTNEEFLRKGVESVRVEHGVEFEDDGFLGQVMARLDGDPGKLKGELGEVKVWNGRMKREISMMKLRLTEQEGENERLLRGLTEARDSNGGDRSPLCSDRRYRSPSPGLRVNASRSQENLKRTVVSPKLE